MKENKAREKDRKGQRVGGGEEGGWAVQGGEVQGGL